MLTNQPLLTKQELAEIRSDLNEAQPDLVQAAINDKGARQQLAKYVRKSYKDYIKNRKEVTEYILREVVGIGFIEELLINPNITDIGWNGTFLTIETNDNYISIQPEELGEGVDEKYIQRIISKFSDAAGKEFTGTNPILDALENGLRLSATHQDASPDGTTFSIRITRPKLALNRDNFRIFAPEFILDFINQVMLTRANITISGTTGTGKALVVGTKVPRVGCMNTLVEDIVVGDYVYNRLGEQVRVQGVYPQGKLPVYEVILKDGRSLKVNDEHLWTVYNGKNQLRTMTTRQMMAAGLSKKDSSYKFKVPMNGGVQSPEIDLPTDPYIVGAFIGNDCKTNGKKSKGSYPLVLSSPDDELPKAIADMLDCVVVKEDGNYSYVFYNVFGSKADDYQLIQAPDILPEEVLTYSHLKRIPPLYLQGSYDQRLALLQGLMDTDGSYYEPTPTDGSIRRRVTYGTVSEVLAEDVLYLARSLGYTGTIVSQTRESNRTEYGVTLQVPNDDKHKLFRYSVKRARALEAVGKPDRKRFDYVPIVDIKDLGYEEEQICIYVDDEEHLFQAGDFVVTHNTELQKLMMSYIPATERIIMIEDVQETHAKRLFPDKDIYSWVTGPNNTITTFVKAALRNNPKWIIVSETRGAEAYEMLQAILTGNNTVTTLHSINAKTIPKRFANMIANSFPNVNEEALMTDILTYFDFGFHIEKIFLRDPDTGQGKLIRYLQEIVEFDEHKSNTLFKQRFSKGVFYVSTSQLSADYVERMEKHFLSYTFPALDDTARTDISDTKEGQLLEQLKHKFAPTEGVQQVDSTLYANYEANIKQFNEEQKLKSILVGTEEEGTDVTLNDIAQGYNQYEQPVQPQYSQPVQPQYSQQQQYEQIQQAHMQNQMNYNQQQQGQHYEQHTDVIYQDPQGQLGVQDRTLDHQQVQQPHQPYNPNQQQQPSSTFLKQQERVEQSKKGFFKKRK